jgi:hypothetical protein
LGHFPGEVLKGWRFRPKERNLLLGELSQGTCSLRVGSAARGHHRMTLGTRRRAVGLAAASLTLVATGALPASAVNADHGAAVVSAVPATFTPQVMNGSVNAITQVGNKIIAAGTFTTVRQKLNSADITRNRIFAFDATTGVIDPSFDPNLGGAANSLTTDGTNIYVGGSFGSVGGSTKYKRVVELTAAGAVVPGFKAVPNSGVNEVVWAPSQNGNSPRLYVGGAFTSIKNGSVTTTRDALASLDPATGAVDPGLNIPFTGVFDPSNLYNGKMGGATNVKRFDVTPDGTRLAAIGNFSTVGGQTHSQLVMLNTAGATATLAPWNTNRFDRAHNTCGKKFDTFTRDIDFSPDGSYFVVSTTGAFSGGAASGTMCDSTSRWETNSAGNDPTWQDYTGGDTTYGVAITGSAVYVGGHMRWENNPYQADQAGPGAVPREGIAALDPVNGLPLSWNPGRSRGVGAQALLATSQGLWVGSDTTRIGGKVHNRIAFMPLAGGTTVPSVPAAVLPNDLFVAPSSGAALLRRPVDGTGAPTAASSTANASMDWSQVRGAFYVNGTVYYGLGDGKLYARTFDKATGAVGAQRTVNLYNDPDNGTAIPFTIANLSGMFYDTGLHRLYYTVKGSSSLYYRYFTPESEVVGALTFTAASSVNLSSVAGMTLAGGQVLYGSTDGALRKVSFSGGTLTGSATTLSTDGTWRAAGMFVPNS